MPQVSSRSLLLRLVVAGALGFDIAGFVAAGFFALLGEAAAVCGELAAARAAAAPARVGTLA